jgi:hypothetical protein
MPEVPIANRSKKGSRDRHQVAGDTARDKRLHGLNASEQGDAANIRQNTITPLTIDSVRLRARGVHWEPPSIARA